MARATPDPTDDVRHSASAFRRVRQQIRVIGLQPRGSTLDTITEVYNGRLTLASFAGHDRRVQVVEQKSPRIETRRYANDPFRIDGQT